MQADGKSTLASKWNSGKVNCARLVGPDMNKRPILYGFREAPIIDLVWCAHGLEHLFKKLLKFLRWLENWVFFFSFPKIWSDMLENWGITRILVPGGSGWYSLSKFTTPDLHKNRCPCYCPFFLNFLVFPPPKLGPPWKKIKSSLKGLCEFRLIWKNFV